MSDQDILDYNDSMDPFIVDLTDQCDQEASSRYFMSWWHTYMIRDINRSELPRLFDRFTILQYEDDQIIVKDMNADVVNRSEEECANLRMNIWYESVMPQLPNREPVLINFASSQIGSILSINNREKRERVISALNELEQIAANVFLYVVDHEATVLNYKK